MGPGAIHLTATNTIVAIKFRPAFLFAAGGANPVLPEVFARPQVWQRTERVRANFCTAEPTPASFGQSRFLVVKFEGLDPGRKTQHGFIIGIG